MLENLKLLTIENERKISHVGNKKITKVYENDRFKQKALDDVSINFRSNEFASILGPSGSSKTTLLNIIGGYQCNNDISRRSDSIKIR